VGYFRACLTPCAEIMTVTASGAVKLQTTDREMISMGGGGWAHLARSVGLLAAEWTIGLPFVGATEVSTPTH
jgi:hypothetical protein